MTYTPLENLPRFWPHKIFSRYPSRIFTALSTKLLIVEKGECCKQQPSYLVIPQRAGLLKSPNDDPRTSKGQTHSYVQILSISPVPQRPGACAFSLQPCSRTNSHLSATKPEAHCTCRPCQATVLSCTSSSYPSHPDANQKAEFLPSYLMPPIANHSWQLTLHFPRT